MTRLMHLWQATTREHWRNAVYLKKKKHKFPSVGRRCGMNILASDLHAFQEKTGPPSWFWKGDSSVQSAGMISVISGIISENAIFKKNNSKRGFVRSTPPPERAWCTYFVVSTNGRVDTNNRSYNTLCYQCILWRCKPRQTGYYRTRQTRFEWETEFSYVRQQL